MAKMHGDMGELKTRAQDRAHAIGEQVSGAYEQVRGQMEHVGGRATGFVRERPVVSVMAGVGIGLILGMLIRR